MTQTPELRKKPAATEQTPSGPTRGAREIRIGGNSVWVTLDLPRLERADAEVILTRRSLRLRSKTDARLCDVTVELPVRVEPGRYVARVNHGVWDVHVLRLDSSV